MEDELVQNILSQSTYDSAWNRFLNKPDWKDKYRTGVSELLSQVKDTQNNNNSFFSSLSGNHVEIPSIESSMEKASQNWAVQDAIKRAEERLAKEKEARIYPTFSTSYDVTRGWRDSTEDAARLDKYIAEELGASPEEVQQVYNDTWSNANKTLGIATAGTLGMAATMGAASGAFGLPIADAVNGLFAVDAARNLASGEGVQKTWNLARQGNWKGALKSGAWDALDWSMLGHTAGLVGRVGKAVLNGRSLGNAYKSDVIGRLFDTAIKSGYRGSLPTTGAIKSSFQERGISPQEAATTYHFDGVIPVSRPISIAEKSGVPKVMRNLRTHGTTVGPYYDYSLINRSYEPWAIDETGQFIFESPEKAKKLSSIHFSLNEPVRSHTMGSWDDAPITTLLPYRNIRSKTAPVDVAIMDTFFPNYSGLKISSRGSKTLTGDKAVYDLYKSKGLDVELNPELESLLDELKAVRGKLDQFPTSERYSADASSMSNELKQLIGRESEITDRIDAINREWTKANAKVIPSYDKLMEFGKSEGLPVEEFPYMLGTPKKDAYGFVLPEFKGFNYDWVSDPSNHAAILQDPTGLLNSINRGEYKVTPEYKKFVEWVVKNKVDYRKHGGILKAQKGRIIKSIGNAAKTKKVELTGDLFAGMGTPKSVFKPRSFKGYSINPGAFSGVENLTPYHWGYNKQIPMLIIKDYKIQSPKVNPISNLEKFLQKSAQERDNIVRYWNGENFSSFSQLWSNPKQLKLFEDWLNKQ